MIGSPTSTNLVKALQNHGILVTAGNGAGERRREDRCGIRREFAEPGDAVGRRSRPWPIAPRSLDRRRRRLVSANPGALRLSTSRVVLGDDEVDTPEYIVESGPSPRH